MAKLALGGPRPVDPARLHEAEQPWRTIDDDRYEDLKHALREAPDMFEARPVIADPAGEVIAGRHRFRAAVELLDEPGRFRRRYGKKGLPTYVRKFTAGEKREWALRDNADYAATIDGEAAEVVRRHADAGGDVRLLGYSDGDVAGLLARTADPDFQPSPPPRSRLDRIAADGDGKCPTCGRPLEE